MINNIHISKNDKVVLSKEKIRMKYGTLVNFAKLYGIKNPETVRRWCNQPTKWGTICNGSDKPINKNYIDWNKTDFYIVDKDVKEAFVKVDQYDEGGDKTWN